MRNNIKNQPKRNGLLLAKMFGVFWSQNYCVFVRRLILAGGIARKPQGKKQLTEKIRRKRVSWAKKVQRMLTFQKHRGPELTFLLFLASLINRLDQGHQCSARWHQVARKDHVRHPRVCSKNDNNMINAFTLTNIFVIDIYQY